MVENIAVTGWYVECRRNSGCEDIYKFQSLLKKYKFDIYREQILNTHDNYKF